MTTAAVNLQASEEKREINEPAVMMVKKRSGELEPVDVNKIIKAVSSCCNGLTHVDPMKVATKTIGGLFDGASTKQLDTLNIQTASLLIGEEPEYSKLAARLLSRVIEKEVFLQNVHSFSQSVQAGFHQGIISEDVNAFVQDNARKLNHAIDNSRSELFEYFGLRTVYDRYLLRSPETRAVFENPQYFLMRVACGLSKTCSEAIELYDLLSSFEYMTATPTLFNSGTTHPQMSSCYLLDSPQDSIEDIYDTYSRVAKLSKYAGGIGLAYHRVRSRGSLIKGTNGLSNGLIPWLKVLDSSVAAVNQGGRRKGAACVYLETWHADIDQFLELKENTGDNAVRTHNLNTANWVPDLFMKRVEADGIWSLFDPKIVPHFTDLFGEAFEKAYVEAEDKKVYDRQVKARDLYGRMMKNLAETGNGWMTWKDACNVRNNQTLMPGNVVHSSNLCTEITEVSSHNETAVCNLGSINLARYITDGKFDFEKLRKNVRTAVKYLDRVIDINFYPTPQAANSNQGWRPIGLGIMGLQDAFFQLGLSFDSPEAWKLSQDIQEEVYFNALWASCQLAEKLGKHASYNKTRASKGKLQFDLWGKEVNEGKWKDLRERIDRHGLRNSLLIAIAPTATIASIVGCYEAIEPQISNLFKRETLSGEFLQINKYLVLELKKIGQWTEEIRTQIKQGEGSIQHIKEIPSSIKAIYRNVWEIPQKTLIDMAAARGPFIDQSQSLNLFLETPTIGKLSSMYMYAWKNGIKTTYYLRSRPATKINKTTVSNVPAQEAVTCSLENPSSCESCQ